MGIPDRRSEPALARSLLRYAEEIARAGVVQTGDAFTTVREADRFIRERPEAFLIGVLFTQGIPADRAWAAPWVLAQRLGHFDLERLAADPSSVEWAVRTRPALHRFVHTLPRWISAAAARIRDGYGGDASRIWPDGTPIATVAERLRAFEGIGEKKAAMAVQLLVRQMGKQLTGLEDGCVAYDVHVRRVFLRSGLIRQDTPEAVRAAARAACPDDPGFLDLATWVIGREFCRPSHPRCDACPLVPACQKQTALTPRGVGDRPVRRDRGRADRWAASDGSTSISAASSRQRARLP